MFHQYSPIMRSLSCLVSQVFCGAGFLVLVLSPKIAFAARENIEFPPPSQHGWIKQRIGLTDVEIDYSRPNKNGRRIFGGLLPYDKVWRTGANASTKIKFSDAIKIEGQEVAAGEKRFYNITADGDGSLTLSEETEKMGPSREKDKK